MHDLAVADVYAAFYPHQFEGGARLLTEWDRSSELYMKLRYDARFRLKGRLYYLEVERGNHPIVANENEADPDYFSKSLNHKLDKYVGYFNGHRDEDATLLITVEDWTGGSYDPHGTETLLNDAWNLVKRYHRGRQILVAKHRDVVGDKDHTEGEIHNEELGDPLGEVWLSPTGYPCL